MRWLAFQLDQFLMLQAFAAASESLVLRAALLRDPSGARVAFAGGRGTGKSWLAIALLAAGWCFEGDAYVFARREGVVPLPRTLRLHTPLRALPPAWREPIGLVPCLRCDGGEEIRAVDPRIFGNGWTLPLGAARRDSVSRAQSWRARRPAAPRPGWRLSPRSRLVPWPDDRVIRRRAPNGRRRREQFPAADRVDRLCGGTRDDGHVAGHDERRGRRGKHWSLTPPQTKLLS